jgi:hypothetical protein
MPARLGETTADLRERIVRLLKARGATNIEARGDEVHFRAERALFNTFNPLTQSRAGSFHVEAIAGGFVIRYELDMLFLLVWTLVAATFGCVIGLISLSGGTHAALAFYAAFFVIIVPINYAFYSWKAKSLFKSAASGEATMT